MSSHHHESQHHQQHHQQQLHGDECHSGTEDQDSIKLSFLKDPNLVSFDSFLKELKPVHVQGAARDDKNTVVYSLTIQQRHCNKLGTLHGGCVATILDDVTSFAL